MSTDRGSRTFRTAALAALALSASANAAPPAAWQQLWRNESTGARAAFRAAAKASPRDAEAFRALGLISLQEDAGGAAMQAWRELYRIAPADWSAAAYWPRFVELAESTGRWALLEGAARDILAAPGTTPELRASARLVLADAADRAGKLAEADKLRASLGYLRQWKVIGPFDNVSLSGFEKQFPPETELDFSKSYPGKDDLALRWHRLSTVSRSGECAVGSSLGDPQPGVFYAATAVSSTADQAALLWFDPSGASKIYLNGELVFRDETHRERHPLEADPFRVPIRLRKGWNTLLVKMADETTDAAFSLRFTTPTGADLALPADPTKASGTVLPASAPVLAPAEPVLVSALRARVRERPEDAEAAAALAYALFHARDFSGAIEVFQAALRRRPESGWLHWELSQALEADGQADEARAEAELARKHHARLIVAQVAALTEEGNGVTPAEQIQRLKALLKVNPASAGVHWALANAYTAAGLGAEALKASRAALASEPGPSHVILLTGFYSELGRTSEVEKILAAGLVTSPNHPALLSQRAESLASLDRPAAALVIYQKLLQLDPTALGHRRSMAELYEAMGNLPKAISTLRAAREQRPQDGSLCAKLADLLRESGKKQEAISLYRTAIALNPAQVWLRDKVQVLSGEQPVLKLVPPTPVQPLLAQAPKAGDAAGASVVALLDEGVQVVYPDYATVTRFHQTLKIMDAAAVQRYQTFPMAVPTATARATVETARILKADGKTQNVADGAFGESFSLPSLAVGDVIDVVYRVEDYQGGGLAKQFWSDWFFDYPGGPSRLSRFVLVTPPGMPITTRAHGAVPEPKTQDVKGWRIREWRRENLPAADEELLGPARPDRATWLDISTVSSWKEVVQWYQALSRPRCMPDAALRAKAAELTKDATTEEAKLRAIVGYVSRQIQYQTTPFRRSAYVPTVGKQVVRERYGDCKDKAALLTALLSAVGIKSEMVLLSGRSTGVTPFLPSPRFNHAIARVHTSKGPLWVDATADQMEFGGLPFEDQQVPALVINDETTDLVLSPALPLERNRLVDHHEGTLTAEGKFTGRLRLEAGGDWGWMLRTVMRLVPEAKRDQVLQGMTAQLVPNSRFERGTMQHLEEQDRPLLLDVQYAADTYSSRAGNFLLLRLPWGANSAQSAEALLGKTARQSDAEVAQARGHYVSSVKLTLPTGYSPQELQSEVKGDSSWGSYRLTYRLEGQTLHATREVRMTTLRVATPEVTKYAEFLRAMEQETRKQLVLKKD